MQEHNLLFSLLVFQETPHVLKCTTNDEKGLKVKMAHIKNNIKKEIINIVSEENYLDSKTDTACYAYDASRIKFMPEAVVFPSSAREISQIMTLATKHLFPVYPRGAGSGLTGGSVPSSGGLVISMEKFNRILKIDAENLYADVEPAVINSVLQKAVEEKGLFYPPDPASMNYSSIGGNIAENAGGMRAFKYGVTKNYVMGLEVVMPDGRIIDTGSSCVKDVVGYDLTSLFVGSEGTLGIITKATLKLLPFPKAKKTLTATFLSLNDAARAVSRIVSAKVVPSTLEFMDRQTLIAVGKKINFPLDDKENALLLIELDGEEDAIDIKSKRIKKICKENGVLKISIAKDRKEQEKLWQVRRNASPSLQGIARYRQNEDVVVPRSKIPEAVERMQEISQRLGIKIINFGHAGDGNIHVNILSDDKDKVEKGIEEVFSLAIELDGRISGEHGIGLSKKEHIAKNLKGTSMDIMKELKKVFDPDNILNPDKIFP